MKTHDCNLDAPAALPPAPGSVFRRKHTGSLAVVISSDYSGVMMKHGSGRVRKSSWKTFRIYWKPQDDGVGCGAGWILPRPLFYRDGTPFDSPNDQAQTPPP